jgi:hypothetical protein
MANKHNISTQQLLTVRSRIGDALAHVLHNARHTSSSAAMEQLNNAFDLLRRADYEVIKALNLSQ